MTIRRTLLATMVSLSALSFACLGVAESNNDDQGQDEQDKQKTQAPFRFSQESQLQLAGTATVGSWDCKSNEVQGNFDPALDPDEVARLIQALRRAASEGEEPESDKLDLSVAAEPDIQLQVKVESLRSGNRRMERDMYEALKSEDHPHVTYQFTNLDDLKWRYDDEGALEIALNAHGQLTLAGVKRDVRIPVTIEPRGDERFRILGGKTFDMSDFDIEPPTALLGLIKADETVEVTFDLLIHMDREHQGS